MYKLLLWLCLCVRIVQAQDEDACYALPRDGLNTLEIIVTQKKVEDLVKEEIVQGIQLHQEIKPGINVSGYLYNQTKKISSFGVCELVRAAVCICAFTGMRPILLRHNPIQDQYPYAAQWYNDLSIKYPVAHLEQKQFLGNSSYGWIATKNSILIDSNEAKRINIVYEKKCKGNNLSKNQQEYMATNEWIVLHEAGHIEHKDAIKSLIIPRIIGFGLESLYQMYHSKLGINPADRNLYVKIGISGSMLLTHHILYQSYSRYLEVQADEFANQHADHNALIGAKNHLKYCIDSDEQEYIKTVNNYEIIAYFIKNQKIPLLHDSHPSFESRIQVIDNEIKKRFLQETDRCIENF